MRFSSSGSPSERFISAAEARLPWVLSTPFGSPVEPEVNRILAGVSAAMCRRRSATDASIEQLASAPKARPRLPSTVTIRALVRSRAAA